MGAPPKPLTTHSWARLAVFAVCYFMLLLPVALLLPLRLGELQQAFASLDFSWHSFFAWIARTPGAVPLGYLAQLPFALKEHQSRFLLRLPSLLGAVATVSIFFRFARAIRVQYPLRATLVFALLPLQIGAATQARPFELSLLFMVLATVQFAYLLVKPSLGRTVVYSLLLTACIYSEPLSFLPAIGYSLFLLRFAGAPTQRSALWHVLPATVFPPLLYLPYYAWATPQRATDWLTDDPAKTLHGVLPETLWIWSGLMLLVLALIGTWSTLSAFTWAAPKRRLLFCLAGGAALSLCVAPFLNLYTNVPFDMEQILAAAPAIILLAFTGVEWIGRPGGPAAKAPVAVIATIFLLALILPADYEFATTRGPEVAAIVAEIPEQMTGESCVVFVSQRDSRFFFLLFHPLLAKHECVNFFHKRVVLASHPWVKPIEQQGAESYFHGLNYKQVYRKQVAGGQVVTLESK